MLTVCTAEMNRASFREFFRACFFFFVRNRLFKLYRLFGRKAIRPAPAKALDLAKTICVLISSGLRTLRKGSPFLGGTQLALQIDLCNSRIVDQG